MHCETVSILASGARDFSMSAIEIRDNAYRNDYSIWMVVLNLNSIVCIRMRFAMELCGSQIASSDVKMELVIWLTFG